jgi:hypothetical protein
MADGMYTLPDPLDPNIVYYNGHFGDITRIDMRNREERYIQPYPPGPAGGGADLEKYRFNWNSPMLMSPSNPDVLYYGGNVLFKTTDRGGDVVDHQSRSDDRRQKQDGHERRPDLGRQHPRRVSLHDRLDCREPARPFGDLGGHRRWEPAADA